MLKNIRKERRSKDKIQEHHELQRGEIWISPVGITQILREKRENMKNYELPLISSQSKIWKAKFISIHEKYDENFRLKKVSVIESVYEIVCNEQCVSSFRSVGKLRK